MSNDHRTPDPVQGFSQRVEEAWPLTLDPSPRAIHVSGATARGEGRVRGHANSNVSGSLRKSSRPARHSSMTVATSSAMIRWFEHRQVYAPSRTLEATGAELGRPFEDVRFLTSDGVRLHGWFFPANPGSPRGHLVIVLLHGNVGNISRRL